MPLLSTALFGPGNAFPVDDALLFNDTAPGQATRKGKIELGILPFGASVMSGQGSTTKNGLVIAPLNRMPSSAPVTWDYYISSWRGYVREALRGLGCLVNMVGRQHSRQMTDNVRSQPLSASHRTWLHANLASHRTLEPPGP